MSTTYEDFKSSLIGKLSGLTLLQQVHAVHRLYEKLRLIHNAVGDVYMHRKTIQQFKTEHPAVYDKVKGELSQFIQGEYINEDGWRYFLEFMFRPRHDVIVQFVSEERLEMRTKLAEYEFEPIE